MTQSISTLDQLDEQIQRIDAQVIALNLEFLTALQTPVAASGETAVEVAARVVDKVRALKDDREKVGQRRAWIEKWFQAEIAPVAYEARASLIRDIIERGKLLLLEAQQAETQAKSARATIERGRQSAMEALKASGVTDAGINQIHAEIQAAKGK